MRVRVGVPPRHRLADVDGDVRRHEPRARDRDGLVGGRGGPERCQREGGRDRDEERSHVLSLLCAFSLTGCSRSRQKAPAITKSLRVPAAPHPCWAESRGDQSSSGSCPRRAAERALGARGRAARGEQGRRPARSARRGSRDRKTRSPRELARRAASSGATSSGEAARRPSFRCPTCRSSRRSERSSTSRTSTRCAPSSARWWRSWPRSSHSSGGQSPPETGDQARRGCVSSSRSSRCSTSGPERRHRSSSSTTSTGPTAPRVSSSSTQPGASRRAVCCSSRPTEATSSTGSTR